MVKLSRTTFGALASIAFVSLGAWVAFATLATCVAGLGVALTTTFDTIFFAGTVGFFVAVARTVLTGDLMGMIKTFKIANNNIVLLFIILRQIDFNLTV